MILVSEMNCSRMPLKNVLFSSSSDSASVDENLADSSISSPSFDDESCEDNFDISSSPSIQYQFDGHPLMSNEIGMITYRCSSAAIRVQRLYRGHLGREIVRWLIIEMECDKDKNASRFHSQNREAERPSKIVMEGYYLYTQEYFNDQNTLFA